MNHAAIAPITRHKATLALAALALAAAGSVILASPARAGLADAWTTYPSMNACTSDLLNLNDICLGLQNGQALGLLDASTAADELDQALDIYYDDENILPAPEGPANPVIKAWNNTSNYLFLAAGTASFAADAAAGQTLYYVPPGADDTGPALDANAGETTYVPPIDQPSHLMQACQRPLASPLDPPVVPAPAPPPGTPPPSHLMMVCQRPLVFPIVEEF